MKRHLHQAISMEVSRSMTAPRMRERSLGIGMWRWAQPFADRISL